MLFLLYLHDMGKLSWRFQRLRLDLWCETLRSLGMDPERVAELEQSKPQIPLRKWHHGLVLDNCGKPSADTWTDNDISAGSFVLDAFQKFKKETGEKFFPSRSSSDDGMFRSHIARWLAPVLSHHDARVSFFSLPVPVVMPPSDMLPALCSFDLRHGVEFLDLGVRLFGLEYGELLPGTGLPGSVSDALRGFCSVCDWIASDTSRFPAGREGEETDIESLSALPDEREDRAVSALVSCGVLPAKRHVFTSSSSPLPLYPEIEIPRGIQSIGTENLLSGIGENEGCLFIAEAPTGSGKTEFAMNLAAELVAGERADGVIFALPTQATANAMYDRSISPLGRMFDGGSAVLSHGAVRKETFSRKFSDDHPLPASEWLLSGRNRSLLGQVTVCTLDQVLLGTIPSRHFAARSFAVSRNVLIVDEVHSYGAWTNILLEMTMERHISMGGIVILLSATLPSFRRKRFGRMVCPSLSSASLPQEYPLVTRILASGTKYFTPSTAVPEYGTRTVKLETVRTENALPTDELYERMVRDMRRGCAVAVVCNTVDNAMEVWGRLKAMGRAGDDVSLFHARFRPPDRAEKERRVIGSFGRNRIPGRGSILVATQVIEQSLDLDFDILYTQICPVELLFQRMGRLFRHELECRAAREPLCVVMSPEDDLFGVHSLLYGGEVIDGTRLSALLWRTRCLAENVNEVSFPHAYRKWIDAVYAPEFDGEPETVRLAFAAWKERERDREYAAEQMLSAGVKGREQAELRIRDGDSALPVLLLLGGDRIFGTEELLGDISVPLNRSDFVKGQIVRVPFSWNGLLDGEGTEVRDGVYLLRMNKFPGGAENSTCSYSPDEGLRKKQKFSGKRRK